jgi:hypothetical protein
VNPAVGLYNGCPQGFCFLQPFFQESLENALEKVGEPPFFLDPLDGVVDLLEPIM